MSFDGSSTSASGRGPGVGSSTRLLLTPRDRFNRHPACIPPIVIPGAERSRADSRRLGG
jgi:hypothetical protein